ncbi:MAG TPA: glycosyl transferase [Candidatus Cloacimonas sp.]|jgi:hypothetical protein|nr:glycosyl transferase [Candidatus Cloacimonas sp.]
MRILLISYYFPPCGGAPVQRWIRFIPRLVEAGCHITVLCSKDGDYPFLDEALCAKIPDSVKVIRVKAPSLQKGWKALFGKDKAIPYGRLPRQAGIFAQFLIRLRLNLIIPDLRVFWNPAAYKAAFEELKRGHYDLIITTGPPHSSHLIGMKLRRQLSIRWLADFRDPWSEIHYMKLNPPCALTRKLHKYLEAKVLASTDTALIVSEAISKALPEGKKEVILNGYDPRDFEGMKYSASGVFRIKYIGQLTAGQDPDIISELCRNIKRDFRLSFFGTRLNPEEELSLSKSCANPVEMKAFVSHKEALKEMVDSELLLLLVNDYEGNQGILTTKLFEYIASGSPILCFSHPSSAAARILMTIDNAKVFSYQDIADATAWVDKMELGQRRKGNIDSYSIDKQLVKLLDALKCENTC